MPPLNQPRYDLPAPSDPGQAPFNQALGASTVQNQDLPANSASGQTTSDLQYNNPNNFYYNNYRPINLNNHNHIKMSQNHVHINQSNQSNPSGADR